MIKNKNKDHKVNLDFIGNNSIGVTGSCILGSFMNENFLIELGGVQDGTSLENYRNNKSLLDKIDFKKINYIFINHFHQDHSQLVLSAVSRGFTGKIITNQITSRILIPLWEDACHIMDADIKFFRSSKGMKIEPLYITDDIKNTINYIYEYQENIIHELSNNISFKLLRNNHVLGSTSIEIFFKNKGSHVKKLFYSSDLGNLIVDKYFVFDDIDICTNADIAILESTYNDKNRKPITKKLRKDDLNKIEDIILNTILNKKGNVLLPSFAADRTQNLMIHIKNIFDKHEELRNIPVIVDGKLTSKIIKLYGDLLEGEQKEQFNEVINWKNLNIISDYIMGTKMILEDNNPKVIISSSGMCDKGHVTEYLKAYVKSDKNSIVFSGFSSPRSLASRIKEKIINPNKKYILIDKNNLPLNCEVFELNSFSSHIQRNELIDMMKQMNISNKIILVHGDKDGRDLLAKESMVELMKIDKTTRVISATKNMHVEF